MANDLKNSGGRSPETDSNLRSIKANGIYASIACVIFGIVLTIWPGGTLEVVSRIFGILVFIVGIVGIFYWFSNRGQDNNTAVPALVVGIVALIAGIFMFAKPKALASLIPTIIGIVVLLNGLFNIVQAWRLRNSSAQGDKAGSFVAGAITIVLGIVILANPFATASVLIRVIGIIMIFNGISNIWINSRFQSDLKEPRR